MSNFYSQKNRAILTFLGIWLISSVAFSSGVVAPELPILANARTSTEYPILRRLQDLTLDLQLLEITLKNRRDSLTEAKITGALQEIDQDGERITQQLKELKTGQLAGIFAFLTNARRFGPLLGVNDSEWTELYESIKNGQAASGTLTVHSRLGRLNILTLTPFQLGRQTVLRVGLPPVDQKNYWSQAHYRSKIAGEARAKSIRRSVLEKSLGSVNAPFGTAEGLAKEYFANGYNKLYAAFETHRYAIFQRVTLARKALADLGRLNTSMGTPEEFAILYNRLLENLFSYGVDLSISGTQRDFTFKGFLFADSPERARELLERLKFSPSASSYNSPSS